MQEIGESTFAAGLGDQAFANLLLDQDVAKEGDTAGGNPLFAITQKRFQPLLPKGLILVKGDNFRRGFSDQAGT